MRKRTPASREEVRWLRGRVGSCPECGRLVGLWHFADGRVTPTDWTREGLDTLRIEWGDSITAQGAAIRGEKETDWGHQCLAISAVGGLLAAGRGATGNGLPRPDPA